MSDWICVSDGKLARTACSRDTGLEVQSTTGIRNRLSEPASRRVSYSGPSGRTRNGHSYSNVFAVPPPAWGRVEFVLRNPDLGPPRAQKSWVSGAPPRDFLFLDF